jgi:hypothetical protein
MSDPLEDAIAEYSDKHGYPRVKPYMYLRYDGYYESPSGDECPQCKGRYWSSNSGSHLKSVEHIAAKHGIRVAELRHYAKIFDFAHRTAHTSRLLDEPEPEPVEKFPHPLEGTLFAWKALSFSVDEKGERVLVSSSGSMVWRPFEVATAQCSHNDACMEESCSCGLYFFWGVSPAMQYHVDRSVTVLAEIGGRVIECEEGCRAEHAVIKAILDYGNKFYVKIASEIYGVPIINKEGDIQCTTTE